MAGQGVSLSADDRFVAWTRAPNDLWLFDVARLVSTPFTFEPAVDMHPVWAPHRRRLVFCAAHGNADDFGTRSILTFNQSFEVPGHSLPAGTSTFIVADTLGRNVVQIFNADRSHLIASFTTIGEYRSKISASPSMRDDRSNRQSG